MPVKPLEKSSKILYLNLRSDWGGAPKHIDILYKNIGPDFLIYFAAPISEPYGISWYKLVGKERFFELEHRKFSISKLLELKSFIKNNEIKIVHAHGKGAGLYGRLLKILLSNSIITTLPEQYVDILEDKKIKDLTNIPYIFISTWDKQCLQKLKEMIWKDVNN